MMTSITRAVQITPFIYSAIFIVVFTAYNLSDSWVLDLIDTLFYVSPAIVIVFLVFSRILHLCRWHRITCIIPIIPQLIDWADILFGFTQIEVITSNTLTIILIILLLVSAYKVFFNGWRKRNTGGVDPTA